MKTRTLLSLLMMFVILCLPMLLHAQTTPPDAGGDPDAAVPFDGGLSILIAAGVGYSVKRVRDERKKRRELTQSE